MEEYVLSDSSDDSDIKCTAGPSIKSVSSISVQSNCTLLSKSRAQFHEQKSCRHRRSLLQLISYCKLNKVKLKYFTGFEENEFKLLFDVVTIPAGFKACVEDDIDKRDQFLLTLMKLRMNFDDECLGQLFNLSESFTKQIVEHWIHRMYIALKGVDFWSLHQKHSGQYDIVIGCIEIPTEEVSVDTTEEGITTKQHNTFKALIGVRESGAVVYCSNMWGGSTSAREILVESDFLKHVKEGQHILADQSFDVLDILEKRNVSLNIPSLKNVDKLTPEQAAVVQRIADRRKIVDKVIATAQEFQILSKPIPTRLWPICEEILFVIVNILNFKTAVLEASSQE